MEGLANKNQNQNQSNVVVLDSMTINVDLSENPRLAETKEDK